MSNPTAKAQQLLRAVLSMNFPHAIQHVAPVAGGFVVALVAPEFTASFAEREAANRLAERVWEANKDVEPDDRVVLFDLKFFPREVSAYSEKAALRAQASAWEDGMPVVATTSLDAFILAHWVDAEVLLIDPLAQKTCRVIQDPEFADSFRIGARAFVNLELGGSHFPVHSVEKLSNDEWCVHLA